MRNLITIATSWFYKWQCNNNFQKIHRCRTALSFKSALTPPQHHFKTFPIHSRSQKKESTWRKIIGITWCFSSEFVRRRNNFEHVYSCLEQHHDILFFYKWVEEKLKTKYKKKNISFVGEILKLEKKNSSRASKFIRKKKSDLSPKELKYCRVASNFTLHFKGYFGVFWLNARKTTLKVDLLCQVNMEK